MTEAGRAHRPVPIGIRVAAVLAAPLAPLFGLVVAYLVYHPPRPPTSCALGVRSRSHRAVDQRLVGPGPAAAPSRPHGTMNKLRPSAVISTPGLVTQQGDVRFAVIADSARRLHAEFGVGWSPRAVLDPHTWLAGCRAVARKRPSLRASSQHTLKLSTEFLVAGGHVLACRHGVHDDRWSVGDLLQLACQYLPATDHRVRP